LEKIEREKKNEKLIKNWEKNYFLNDILPVELFCNICFFLNEVKQIFSFSLTCKKFFFSIFPSKCDDKEIDEQKNFNFWKIFYFEKWNSNYLFKDPFFVSKNEEIVKNCDKEIGFWFEKCKNFFGFKNLGFEKGN
jgi:hypothetical protein